MNQPAQASAPTIPVKFTGKAGEYFGIWIVNILLTIITLGIYSAWAKVRTQRYFYGNTLLAGSPFDYLANPVAILKGWAIAIVVLIVYNVVTDVFPVSLFVLFPLLLAALPWVIVRAMRFRARNSSWRNIRFGFKKAYGEAARVFILFPILMVLTLGLFFPYYYYASSRFIVANSGFGTTAFSFHATAKDFYKIFLKPVLLMLVVFGVAFAASYSTFKEYTDKIKAGMETAQTQQQESDESLYDAAEEMVEEQTYQDEYADVQPEYPDATESEAGVEMERAGIDPQQLAIDQHDEMLQQAMQDLATANDELEELEELEYADINADEMEGSGDEEYANEADALAAQQAQQQLDNSAEEDEDAADTSAVAVAAAFMGSLLMMLFYLVFIAYIQARSWNLIYNSIELAGNRFISTVRARDMAWLYASNLIMILITFGLMIPWAKIRLARYRADKLQFQPAGNLDSFMQAQSEKVSALGEELGDVFDLDIGI